jgi:hypothetical protein
LHKDLASDGPNRHPESNLENDHWDPEIYTATHIHSLVTVYD